ncbi:MAG: BTAD domain-containing putative transcriptional regulator [Acidimicrobiales bacterium]
MEYRLLGPLEVVRGDEPLDLGPPRQRALLALLLVHANQVVAFDRIVDALWGERPPSSAPTLVHGYISGLRKVIEPDRSRTSRWDVIVTRAPGYVMVIDTEELDVTRFERLFALGSGLVDEEPSRASTVLGEAIDLWRGPALGDLAYEAFAQGEIVRLEELRLAAVEWRIDADLALGRHHDLLGELTRLVAEHPLRERLRGQQMLALYRSDRQAEALAAFEELRQALLDEMGLDPGPELRAIEYAILRQDETSRRPPRPRATNLPAQLTSFVGREQERADIAALVGGHRLVTLTGPGGGGKTRLAVEVAGSLVDGFGDGVWLVELAALSDPALVPDAVATAIGVRAEPGRPLVDSLAGYLAHRRMLLVLDNAEHVIDAAATLAAALLRSGAGSSVLATSREALGVPGERVYVVPSLPTADAVQLFVDRAAGAGAGPFTGEAEAGAVVRICEQLDGIPLAVELAAALTGSLAVTQIADRLDERFLLLTRGNRAALPRHQTLAACVQWSYELLTADEQHVFDRLSVMTGPFGADAAAVICGDEPLAPSAVVPWLARLVDVSLVTRDGDRYVLLETLRQYGADRLIERGEADAVRDRHAGYYRSLVERHEPALYTAESSSALAILEAEQDQLRAALQWCFADDANRERARVGVAIAGHLGWPWHMWGALEEGRIWLRAALRVTEHDRDRDRVLVLYGAAMVSSAAGDIDRALDFYGRTAELATERLEWALRADATSGMASARWAKGELDRAFEVQRQAVTRADEAGSLIFGAQHRALLARIHRDRGELDEAGRLLDTALSMSRRLGERMTIGLVLDNQASLAAALGDHERAARLGRESLDHYRAVPYREGITSALRIIGGAMAAMGRYDEAEAALSEALALGRRLGHRGSIASQLDALARIANARGAAERAALLKGASEGVRAAIQLPAPGAEAEAQAQLVKELDATLGREQAATIRARGAALALDEAVAVALDVAVQPA